MSTVSAPVKVVVFAASLALALGISFGVARAVAPGALGGRGDAGHEAVGHDAAATTVAPTAGGHGVEHGAATPGADAPAALHGLESASAGLRLVPEQSTLTAGDSVPFRFRILRSSGRPLTSYRPLHERELHLIVVRRDLTGFQHVHPTRDAEGTWSVELRLPAGGTWRAFTDLSPGGGPDQITLGTDLQVAGTFQPGALPAAVAASPDSVSFDRSGDRVAVTVARGGAPVTPDPYLGARGHLVAIRTGDLGYAHVHPEDGPGPAVSFAAHLPPGSYALFFDYSTNGAVTTATSTLEVHQ